MEEPAEAISGAVERAADQRSDVRRSQKAVARQLTDDHHVIVGKTEGRRLRRTAEPRPSRGGSNFLHKEIIASAGRALQTARRFEPYALRRIAARFRCQ
jgi:hypothetical protein